MPGQPVDATRGGPFRLVAGLSDAGIDYRIAGVLLVVGAVLWAVTYAFDRYVLHQEPGKLDPQKMDTLE